jgi:hypothetical protein
MQAQLRICAAVGIAPAIEEIKAAMDMCVIGLEENMKTQRGTSKIAEMQARGQAC